MLVYILGITKQVFRNTNLARGITNRVNLGDFKSKQKRYKSAQGFQIGAKKVQIRAEITNPGRRDYKSGQALKIGSEQYKPINIATV